MIPTYAPPLDKTLCWDSDGVLLSPSSASSRSGSRLSSPELAPASPAVASAIADMTHSFDEMPPLVQSVRAPSSSVTPVQVETPKVPIPPPTNVNLKPRLPKTATFTGIPPGGVPAVAPIIPPPRPLSCSTTSSFIPPIVPSQNPKGGRGYRRDATLHSPVWATGPRTPLPVDNNYWGWAPPSVPLPPPLPPMAYPAMITKPHERYFFPDGNIAFQLCNGTIYKVHRYHFSNSTVCAMTPVPNQPMPERAPIYLYGVDPQAFELLLSILYPKDLTRYEVETVDEWSQVLSFASQYSMENVKKLAINQLKTIATPVDKIALANDYDIQEWLVPAFTELCLRSEPLSLNEGAKLGIEAVVKIGQLKHQIIENLRHYVDKDKVATAVEDALAEDDDSSLENGD